jgi:hypothetical protein
VWAAMKPSVVYASIWLASTPPVYWLPQTWPATLMVSKPAASAAWTASLSVGPRRAGPSFQFVIAMCTDSFIAGSRKGGARGERGAQTSPIGLAQRQGRERR